MLLKGKVAMVTGVGRGIGKATALALAKEGSNLVLAELNEETLFRTTDEVRAIGAEVVARQTDVTDSEQVHAIVAAGIERFGRIDVLVNNVGGNWGGMSVDVDEETWHKILDLNVTSQFLCAKAVVPHMQAQRDGRIVNIASNAGRYMSRYFAGLPYCAAKAGVSGLTRELAYRLARDGIRVNAIEPGHVFTELTAEDWPRFSDELKKTIIDEIPLSRMAEPSEIADAIVFLASDESSYMTGATLEVNGGLWMS
ncbi:MAG TPA: hypothetical protein DEP84_02860 [Chloroflexi bacterium]|nr:hypothetical protein [Chloroflexota bacterium]